LQTRFVENITENMNFSFCDYFGFHGLFAGVGNTYFARCIFFA